MNAARLKEILAQQFGINNEEEFNMAVEKCSGIDLGLFSTRIAGRSVNDEQTKSNGVA